MSGDGGEREHIVDCRYVPVSMTNFIEKIKKEKNTLLIILGAMGLHLTAGQVYAWSVFTKPLIATFGWSLMQVSMIFSLAIFALGMTAAFAGKQIEQLGPKKSAIIGTVLFLAGFLGSAYALSIGSLPLLYLCYSGLFGCSTGVFYLAPCKTVIAAMPNHKGMAGGLCILAFGASASIASILYTYLMSFLPIATVFLVSAGLYAILLAVSLFAFTIAQTTITEVRTNLRGLTFSDAIKTKTYYKLWFLLGTSIFVFIGMISVCAPMAMEMLNIDAVAAAGITAIVAIFNGAGRIFWSTLSDYLGTKRTYTLIYTLYFIMFGILMYIPGSFAFKLAVFTLASLYGGGFSVIPAYIADTFGLKEHSRIHGTILSSWAIASITSVPFLSWIHMTFGAYVYAIPVYMVLIGIMEIVSLTTVREYAPQTVKINKR